MGWSALASREQWNFFRKAILCGTRLHTTDFNDYKISQ